jgi:hypothetical protein
MWQEVCPSEAPFFRNLSLDQVTLTAPLMSPEETVMAILWSDVVGQCLNDSRAAVPPHSVQGSRGKNMIIARLRFLGIQCERTRETIRSMRIQHF